MSCLAPWGVRIIKYLKDPSTRASTHFAQTTYSSFIPLHPPTITTCFAFAPSIHTSSPHLHSFSSSTQSSNTQNNNDSYWAYAIEHTYDDATVSTWKEQYPNLVSYSNSDLMIWKKAFDDFDRDHDGFISQADLQKAPTFSLQKSKLLKNYDKDQNNLIDLGEFVEAMFIVDLKSLRDTFEGFDQVDIQLEFEQNAVIDTTTGKKTLTLERIKKIMESHSFTCVTELDAQTLFNQMDVNQDGEVDLEDFKQWV